jgi:hypothetical protein
MPRYVVERLFDQREPTPRDSQVAKRLLTGDFKDLVWEHSHVVESDDSGAVRSFCIYSGPSEHRIREHAALLAPHTVVNIYEIAADVAPEDIPDEGEPAPEHYARTPDPTA